MLMSPELYLDSILYIINENSDKARKLILELINLYEGEVKRNTAVDDEATRFYIRVLRSIMDAKLSKENTDELRMVLLKFKSDPALTKRQEIYELLTEIFLSPQQLAPARVDEYAIRIHNALLTHKCLAATKNQYATLARAQDMVNPFDQHTELKKIRKNIETINEAFEEEQVNTATVRPRSLVESVDFTNRESMGSALVRHRDRAINGVLKLGLAGLNRMLGTRGGLARGESLVFYALPHNYKSGLLMSIALWVALYNVPSTSGIHGTLKPLILLISLENEAYQNFVWMFRHHYETTLRVSSKRLTDDEVTEWAYATFSAQGYTLIIERHLPYQFTFDVFVETCEFYKRQGYEVVLASVDYPNLMNKSTGLSREEGGNHLAVKALFSSMCNYTKNEGITFTGAHPLNRKAQEVVQSGRMNIVKHFDSSHLADSFDVAREVDLEIYGHIERNLSGVAYLTMQRGKHRYVDDTPDAHKYCAYRFTNFGIMDDINASRPGWVSDIYEDSDQFDSEKGDPLQPIEQELITSDVF